MSEFKIKRFICLNLLVFLVFGLFAFSGAVVWTDKDDYSPGEIVIISGSGFEPNAELLVKVIRPDGSVVTGDGSFRPWPTSYDYAKASEEGTFEFNYVLNGILGEYTVEVIDVATSNILATTRFTDAPKVGSVVVGIQNPNPVIQGNSATYTITVNRGSGSGSSGSFTANLSITTTLPTGVSYSFNPNPVSFTPSDNSKTATLTITTSMSTPPGSYNFTVKAATSASDYAEGNGTLNVALAPKQNQTITVTQHAPSSAVYNTSFNVAATASSGLPVAITTSGSCIGSGSGSAVITMTSGIGTCTVHYNQAGNENYNPAPEVTENVSAQKADRICTLATNKGWTRTYVGEASETTCSVSAGSDDGTMVFTRNSVNVSSPDSITNAGTYEYSCQWTGGTNYNDCPVQTNTLTINKADPTCNITGWTGTYDGDPHGASGSCTGVKGETLAGLDLGATFTNVPGGTANWTFTDVTGNYNDDSGSVEIVI
ncbi:MAG: hypothetical protein QXM75_03560, partial [Candidatus Diapherotrites archaeon]